MISATHITDVTAGPRLVLAAVEYATQSPAEDFADTMMACTRREDGWSGMLGGR